MELKKTEKKLEEYKDSTLLSMVFTDIDVFFSTISFIKTVLIHFFCSQFARKLGLTKTPIAKVDNDLDKKIPFTPSKVGTYLDFTSFWFRPLSMLIKKLGRKKAKPYIIKFLHKINLAYSSAAKVYETCMSTTDRPRYHKMFYFRVIHIFDPHYLCVPSLHITVVALVWNFYREAFKEIPELTEEEKKIYLDEIYEGSIKIAETVLYIKQHSVNCIPAALYMMTFIMKPYFTASDAIQFLHDMFLESDISPKDQKQMKDYMYFIFERFLLAGVTGDNWIEPIKAWLKEYCIDSNQAHIAEKIK